MCEASPSYLRRWPATQDLRKRLCIYTVNRSDPPIRHAHARHTLSCVLLRAPSPIRRRQPERTVRYRAVQSHLATWLELAQDEYGCSALAHVEREFHRC